jgi:mRNA interferase RelE/StbE
MTYAIIWQPEAIASYRRLRTADSDGAKQIARAVTALAADPHPAASRALGGTNFRRLRLGHYRVLYEVTDVAVCVMHVGRVPGR